MDSNMEDQSNETPEPAPPTTEGLEEGAVGDAASTIAEGGESDGPTGETDDRLPDAGSLVAMAAMHMETTALMQVLTTVFHAHAWRSMGLVADHSGEVKKNMASAQTAIDCFAFLLSKIEGSLNDAEKRDVQRRLMDLRMNYVAKLREGQS